jgi:enoyl-CoA hydratase/carnithine racemase
VSPQQGNARQVRTRTCEDVPAGGKLLLDAPASGVARLTIFNPKKRNALDHDILDGIAAALDRLTARCLIISGPPGLFSAGYDIGEIPQERFVYHAERLVAHPFTAAIDAVETYRFPTIAALPGPAIGGGLELAVACDFRIAAATARLGMPPAKLGLVYSHNGLRRFIDAIGAPRTRELFLLGRQIDATTALAWGLVTAVVSEPDLSWVAVKMANELVANSPVSVSGNKQAINSLLKARSDLDDALEEELIALRRASFESADMREGVRAFVEKRPPRWPES